MSNLSAKERFLESFRELSQEEKLVLVEEHLAQLLDDVSVNRASEVLSAVKHAQTTSKGIPHLDLDTRKAEYESLFSEIEQDAKSYTSKDRSKRLEIIDELVSSLGKDVNEIWQIVFEYRRQFSEAHRCLLYLLQVTERIWDLPLLREQRCRCNLTDWPVYISICRHKDGTVVKRFALSGILSIHKSILWVWRDLFLSYLVHNEDKALDNIGEMLNDIDALQSHRSDLGWAYIERLLYGGSARRDDNNEDVLLFGGSWEDNDINDEDQMDEWDEREDDPGPTYAYQMNASHWNPEHRDVRGILWDTIEDTLCEIFEERPSSILFSRLSALSENELEGYLFELLEDVQANSSDNLAASLAINTNEDNSDEIDHLLSTYSHLLRPRDYAVYQDAVGLLAQDNDFRDKALQLIEKELLDTVSAIFAKMRYYFPGILESGRATEIDSILKQTRSGSDGRRSRVNEWVESVKALGGGNGFPNGINMLAAAFGLMPPPGPDEFDLDDPVSLLLDDDGGGPNKKSGLEDLREEWRPPLKAQFEGWTRTAGYLKAQTVQALLIRVYKVTIRKMPFFRSPDIIEEMIQVCQGSTSRLYVCEYLETLDAFCKQQRKKINSINKAKKAHTPSSSKQPRSTPRLHRKDSNSSLPPLEPIPSSSSSPPAQDPINAPPPQSSSLFSTLFGFPSPVQGGLDDVD